MRLYTSNFQTMAFKEITKEEMSEDRKRASELMATMMKLAKEWCDLTGETSVHICFPTVNEKGELKYDEEN